LAKKGPRREAKLAYVGGVLMENRHGRVVDACVVAAFGTGERDAATDLLQALPTRPANVGGDKAYDTSALVETARAIGVTPHVAQAPRSAIAGRTTRHAGYQASQRHRKRIEEVFGWMKTIGGLCKLRHRGTAKVEWHFLFVAAAYNLIRLRTLTGAAV
jgi:IS5 family transposase